MISLYISVQNNDKKINNFFGIKIYKIQMCGMILGDPFAFIKWGNLQIDIAAGSG